MHNDKSTDILDNVGVNAPHQHVLVYIVYGDDEIYYQGVQISILSFFSHVSEAERPLVVVLSERPEFFDDFPVLTLPLSQQQKTQWATDEYWYRLKTLGLAHVITTLQANNLVDDNSKFLFFDTDTYFEKNPMPLYEMIGHDKVVMYKKEPKIFVRKKYRPYVSGIAERAGTTGLAGETVTYEYGTYQLEKNANMWSSLIMGVMTHSLSSLQQAAALMYPVRELTYARTVEQFCFAEVFKQRYSLRQGKAYVRHYSRKRQKQWVAEQLTGYYQSQHTMSFEEKIQYIKALRFQRPWWVALWQGVKRRAGEARQLINKLG